MSVIPQLASSLKRNDEEANIALAQAIVEKGNRAAVQELMEHLQGKDKAIASDCIKVLYEIGERQASLIADYADEFVSLLHSRQNRLQWGAMTALGQIVPLTAASLIPHIERLKTSTKNGSVITQDWGIRVLAGIVAQEAHSADQIMPFLLDFLRNCRPKDVPRHAESIIVAVTDAYRQPYVDILAHRKLALKGNALKRVEKLIKKLDSTD